MADIIYDYPATPLKVAFIGGGINSAVGRAHYSALRLDGLFEVVAGAFSRNADINQKSAIAYGVDPRRAYPDHSALIAAEADGLDAVLILTPTSAHLEPVIDALEAGIPVICEKALASRIEDSLAIEQTVNQKKGFLAVTYNYTGYPALRELRALIAAGVLGQLRHFRAEMPQEGFQRIGPDGKPLRPQDWRLRDGTIPTVHLDLGVHLHQIIHYLTGLRPLRVRATQRSYGHFDVIDYVDASIDYENGLHGHFYYGKSMLGYRNGLSICLFGDHGSAEWQQTDPERLRLAFANGRQEVRDRGCGGSVWTDTRYTRFKAGHPAGYVEAFANLYADIHACLLDYQIHGAWSSQEVYGVELAIAGLRMLQAIAEADSRDVSIHLDAA